MGLRAIFAGLDAEGSDVITRIISDLGHDIRTVSGPDFCHAYVQQETHCSLTEPCCDVLILSNRLHGELNGQQLLAWQKRCGCKIRDEFCAVLASEPHVEEKKSAALLGATVFTDPCRIKELVDWLYRAQKGMRNGSKMT